jgi:hypothetical protein
MKIHKLYIAIGLMIALGLLLELVAHASELNQQTKITFIGANSRPGTACRDVHIRTGRA